MATASPPVQAGPPGAAELLTVSGGGMLNDPHVTILRYRLETDASLAFDSPAPREHDTPAFALRLADGLLTCDMKAHFTSVAAAKAVVEPVLRAWELETALREGKRAMWFAYQDAEVIDRHPAPPSANLYIQVNEGLLRVTGELVSLQITRREYPAPPPHFTASADVETLWHRYEGYQQGREPLLAMAYFCLSVLEWRASQHPGRGDVRAWAESLYGIEREVLRKLGDLTANLGDETTARKIDASSLHHTPTPQEIAWIEAAIKLIIRRVGEHAADSTVSQPTLGMRDLPPL